MTCPKCGAQMTPIALGPETAPWLCAGCARGFFAAELTSEARAIYRPRHDDWGFSSGVPIRAAVERELNDARERGTSLREDQFVHTPSPVLASLAHRRLGPAFKALVESHLTNIGAR